MAQAYGIALVVGLIVSLLICTSYKAAMKSAVKAHDADRYVRGEGMDFSRREDHYTNTTRSERKIQTQNKNQA